MLPGGHLPADGTEGQGNPTEGSAPLKSTQETLLARDPAGRGNTVPADLISSQPLPAAAPPGQASQEAAGFKKPTCPRCGLAVPDHRQAGPPLSPGKSRLQGSKQPVRNRRRSRGSEADSCMHLLLACLSCQGSVLLLGLLEACSSCLHPLCSSCCHACARCCSAIQEAPVEELNCHAHCHSVLFESCCEPTECLEFCLECCDICHRS